MSDKVEQATNQAAEVSASAKDTTNSQHDLSSVIDAINKLNDKIDNIERNRFSPNEIKDIAAKNVIQREVTKQEEYLTLEQHEERRRKGKSALETRNELWEEATEQFLDESIPRGAIYNAMNGPRSDMTDLVSICMFRYLAPSFGVSYEKLNKISLTQGESDFNKHNSYSRLARNAF